MAVFTSGKMHFILLCLSSAVVAQDTPGLRRLLSAAAISPACGLICLHSPPTLCVHLPADSHLMKQEVSDVPVGMLLTLLPVAFVALASCSSLGLIPSCVNQVGCDSMLDFIVGIVLL